MGSTNVSVITILFLLSLFLSIFSVGFCYVGCIKREREALLNFKLHLSRPSNKLSDWVAGGDCCRWHGVVCHNSTGHVLELHLRTLSLPEYIGPRTFCSDQDDYLYYKYFARAALAGNISPSLLNLTYLRYLDLSYNDFGGIQIPEFLGSIKSLRYLNLSQAGFGGMIPHKLGNLSNLQYLDLRLDGNIQVENLHWISGLSSLKFLDMSDVDLSKSFDWLNAINSLPSLLELHLSYCELSDSSFPVNLNFSLSLAVLDLSYNHFHDPILNGLQNLSSSLKELILGGNSFNSSITNWLYGFTHLEVLDFGFSDLQGNISGLIGNMTSLTRLDLSYNEFEGGIPISFKRLCNLRSLDLDGVNLSQKINYILEIFSGCVSDELESLSLYQCHLSGYLTDDLAQFKNLASLELSNNLFSGPIPKSFKQLCNLRSLEMNDVILSQEINDVLEILLPCSSNVLESLSLRGCELSGYLTDSLDHFNNLERLDLDNNMISGSIPSSLGEMTSLRKLYLSSNRLNGTPPASFGRLTNLEIADISDNLFEGNVTEFHFANLTKLSSLDASMMNKGLVLSVRPNWIPPLQLYYLRLRSWQVGPQFPAWLQSLKHLMILDISNSGISSNVPDWYWNMSSNFGYANLSRNHLHGVIPNILIVDRMNSIIDLSSNNFSGPLPYFSSTLRWLDLSSNYFSGSINNFLCYKLQEEEVKFMQVLNLGANQSWRKSFVG